MWLKVRKRSKVAQGQNMLIFILAHFLVVKTKGIHFLMGDCVIGICTYRTLLFFQYILSLTTLKLNIFGNLRGKYCINLFKWLSRFVLIITNQIETL